MTVGINDPRSAGDRDCGPRADVERESTHTDPVIGRALAILGQSINPVRLVGFAELRKVYLQAQVGEPPAGILAFRHPGERDDPAIYLNADSMAYRAAARAPSAIATLRIAAILVHEQVHNSDDDAAAYQLQADFVRDRLDAVPWPDRRDAWRDLEELQARARAQARAERRHLALRSLIPILMPSPGCP